MAEKRFIARRITESDKIRSLANEGKLLATSVYMWLLPYTDRAGRINANAYYLKGGIFQGYGFTLEELTAAVDDLARVGLVHLYGNGRHDRIIQYAKFHVDDGGFNKPHDREAASTLPGPDDAGSTSITTVGAGTNERRDKVPDKVLDPAIPRPRQSPEELKVELELELELEKNPPTPLAQPEPLAPPDVEPAARLSLEPESPPSAGKKPKPKPKKAVEHEFNPVVVAGELPPQFDPDRFLAFCGMRLKRGWPMTLEALKAFLRKHQKHPRAVLDEMFDNAIVGQWQDLYPLKHDRPTGSARASPARDLPTAADFEHVPTNAELLGLTGGEPN